LVAAVYGARYIADRFLPDKSIDLIDEAASSLRLAQESKMRRTLDMLILNDSVYTTNSNVQLALLIIKQKDTRDLHSSVYSNQQIHRPPPRQIDFLSRVIPAGLV
jgi:ATP-dependent Clp protease ATP-binding subunit ClpA